MSQEIQDHYNDREASFQPQWCETRNQLQEEN